jgi:acylglycerol lipase
LTARIDLPILIMGASADRLASPEGANWLYSNISSKDKTLKQYQGLYHEILNEPEKELVLPDIENWLAKQLIVK